MDKRSVEIMAPAGSYESLSAAIKAGCNSVYFGVEQLNMRSRSTFNFTTEDLPNIASICKENNIKSYLTLNTIMYDHDLKLLKVITEKAKESGISAIIASDHAVMAHALKIGMPLHISTQANITNIETVEFYAAFADVMVLSRELSLQQVAYITKEIKRRKIKGPSGELVKIEIFAHGALCMAVSGKCYLSLHSHNASANRGACIQNCRREYIVTDKEEGYELAIDNEYIMSAKDLCTIGFLDKILEAGVNILKIEGRGRAADYVLTTVKCYREAVDAIADGTYTKEKVQTWENELATVFNRGFWDGYYLGRKMGEWNDSYGSKATKKKIYLGRNIKYFGKIKVAEFVLDTHALKCGDEILITGPSTGAYKTVVKEIRVNDQCVDQVEKGVNFSIPVEEKIRPSDKLYKIINS
ncbi:peptidase U32 family protein [Cytophagaceae bacterium ABcell3]|nr:peptidase U32 family protein [Cytophagaceae bacterium ABcell3]